MTVHGIEQVFFASDPLPAQQHDAVGIEGVGLAADRSETCDAVAVLVKIVCVAIDLLELVRTVGAVLIAIFDAARGLDELGYISVSCRQSRGGVFS